MSKFSFFQLDSSITFNMNVNDRKFEYWMNSFPKEVKSAFEQDWQKMEESTNRVMCKKAMKLIDFKHKETPIYLQYTKEKTNIHSFFFFFAVLLKEEFQTIPYLEIYKDICEAKEIDNVLEGLIK